MKIVKYIVASLSFLCLYPSLHGQRLLIWHTERPLKWADFWATPPYKTATLRSHFAAVTVTVLVLDPYHVDPETGWVKHRVYAAMDRTQSYYDTTRASPAILRHEQLHFDIAEWYARKLNQVLEAKGYIPREMGNEIFRKYFAEYQQIQDTCEQETQYGQYTLQQMTWEKEVAKKLATLYHYSYQHLNQ